MNILNPVTKSNSFGSELSDLVNVWRRDRAGVSDNPGAIHG
jgi:hypothetical protein